MSRVRELLKLGQSVWLDYIRRDMLDNGQMKRLVEEDGLRGMTSNPAIFEKSIADTGQYDDQMKVLIASHPDLSPEQLFEKLAVRDIQDAADILMPVYLSSEGADGFVSLEVAPNLANDEEKTIQEARRLSALVNRPNLMVNVPGTEAGCKAVEVLIGEGISINVTLLFSPDYYEKAARAYIKGLKAAKEAGKDIRHIGSVASFFVSRIDSLVDQKLEEVAKVNSGVSEKAKGLMGKIAIANAKNVYQSYKSIFAEADFLSLKVAGARPQRMLWASTGTKNPSYPDTLYVDTLIGSDTVNTLPPATYEAFKDHGVVASTIEKNVEDAAAQMKLLEDLGIHFKAVTDQLLSEGIRLFEDAYSRLLVKVEEKKDQILDHTA